MRSLLVVAAAAGVVPVLTVVACREPAPAGPVAGAGSASTSITSSASATSASAAEPTASSAPPEASVPSAPPSSSPVASALPKPKTAAECKKTIEKAQSMGDDVVARHSKCQSDGDCVTVSAGVCLARCETAIARTGVGEREAALKKAQPLCDAFVNSDCIYKYPVPVPSCPAYVARCKAGACKAEVK